MRDAVPLAVLDRWRPRTQASARGSLDWPRRLERKRACPATPRRPGSSGHRTERLGAGRHMSYGQEPGAAALTSCGTRLTAP